MEIKKLDIKQREHDAALLEQVGKVLEKYENGDTLVVIRLRPNLEKKGQYHTNAATGIITDHLPMLAQVFERLIEKTVENLAKEDPYTAGVIIDRINKALAHGDE